MGAQKILQEIKSLESWVNLWKVLDKKAVALDEFIQLAEMEQDESFRDDIET